MPQQTVMTKLAMHVTLPEKSCVQWKPKTKFRNLSVTNNLPPNKQAPLSAFPLFEFQTLLCCNFRRSLYGCQNFNTSYVVFQHHCFNAVSDVRILPNEAKSLTTRGVLVILNDNWLAFINDFSHHIHPWMVCKMEQWIVTLGCQQVNHPWLECKMEEWMVSLWCQQVNQDKSSMK